MCETARAAACPSCSFAQWTSWLTAAARLRPLRSLVVLATPAGDLPRAVRSVVRNFVRSVPSNWLYSRPASWNRTSCFVGCTFTSTISGGMSSRRKQIGCRPVSSRPRYASPSACCSARSRIARPLRNRYCIRPVARLCIGLATKPASVDAVALAFDLDQVVGDLLAEERGDALADVVDRRQVVHQPAVVREREVDLRMGERQPRERLGRVAHLGLRRAQELVPHRRVEEQVAHFDRRADGAADRRDRLRLAADDFQLGAALGLRGAAADHEPADLGDRGQRFAAEAERARR